MRPTEERAETSNVTIDNVYEGVYVPNFAEIIVECGKPVVISLGDFIPVG